MFENKRRTKHGQLAKSKEEIYEERVDRARNMGTIETGVPILAMESTQQSSNQPKTTAKCSTVAVQQNTRHDNVKHATIIINTLEQKQQTQQNQKN